MTVRSQKRDWNIEESGKRQEMEFNVNVGTVFIHISPAHQSVSLHPLSPHRKTFVETRMVNRPRGATQWILM